MALWGGSGSLEGVYWQTACHQVGAAQRGPGGGKVAWGRGLRREVGSAGGGLGLGGLPNWQQGQGLEGGAVRLAGEVGRVWIGGSGLGGVVGVCGPCSLAPAFR